MLADLLGTTWFVILTGVVSFIAGVYFASTIKKMLHK